MTKKEIIAKLIDMIEGMLIYYGSGPLHQPSSKCVCSKCIKESLKEIKETT